MGPVALEESGQVVAGPVVATINGQGSAGGGLRPGLDLDRIPALERHLRKIGIIVMRLELLESFLSPQSFRSRCLLL